MPEADGLTERSERIYPPLLFAANSRLDLFAPVLHPVFSKLAVPTENRDRSQPRADIHPDVVMSVNLPLYKLPYSRFN